VFPGLGLLSIFPYILHNLILNYGWALVVVHKICGRHDQCGQYIFKNFARTKITRSAFSLGGAVGLRLVAPRFAVDLAAAKVFPGLGLNGSSPATTPFTPTLRGPTFEL